MLGLVRSAELDLKRGSFLLSNAISRCRPDPTKAYLVFLGAAWMQARLGTLHSSTSARSRMTKIRNVWNRLGQSIVQFCEVPLWHISRTREIPGLEAAGFLDPIPHQASLKSISNACCEYHILMVSCLDLPTTVEQYSNCQIRHRMPTIR